MALELSTDQKRSIIVAAVTAAGPGADDGQVASQVTRIVDLFEDGSPAMRAFVRAEERAEKTTDVKSFAGEILFVDMEGLGEKPSNRPIVFLRTQVSESAPEGIEVVRLDRIDSQDSERVRALANQALELVGHKVGVTVAVEKMANSSNKVRILRAVEDRGPGGTDLAGLTNEQGWKLIDWQNGGKDRAFSKIAPRLVRLQKFASAAQPALAGA